MAGKQGKASAKHGRNKPKCKVYEGRMQRERNKVKNLDRHIKDTKHRDDVAEAAKLRAKRAIALHQPMRQRPNAK